MKKNLLRLIAIIGSLGLIFNISRIFYILNVRASLHPTITIEGGLTNDLLAWTALFAGLSLVLLIGAGIQLRGNAKP